MLKATFLVLLPLVAIHGTHGEYRTKMGDLESHVGGVKGEIGIVGSFAQGAVIENFHYDGKCKDAFFYVGTTDTVEAATQYQVLYPEGSTNPLKKHTGSDVTLSLPYNMVFQDLKWVLVWCISSGQNLASFMFPKELGPLFNRGSEYSLDDGTSHVSGQVYKIDNKTIEIWNLEFNGFPNINTGIYIGTSLPINAANGIRIPHKVMGRCGRTRLNGLLSETVKIWMPGNVIVDDVKWISVWNEDDMRSMSDLQLHLLRLGFMESEEYPDYLPTLNGAVYMVDEQTVEIRNMNFISQSSIRLYVGYGSPSVDYRSGKEVAANVNFVYGTHRYTIKLKSRLTELKWMSFVDFQFKRVGGKNFVYMKFLRVSKTKGRIGQKVGDFKNSNAGLVEGSVYKRDQNTIVIKNFKYKGTSPKVYIHVGTGLPIETYNGQVVPLELTRTNGWLDRGFMLHLVKPLQSGSWIAVFNPVTNEKIGHVTFW